MRPVQLSLAVAFAVFCAAGLAQAQTAGAGGAAPVLSQAVSTADLKSVPDGNWLVRLEVDGKIERINLLVQDNRGKCVSSSDPKLQSIQAHFQLKSKGVFLAHLQGGDFRASQLWIFRADGAAAIREIPDRGELQSAVRVKGETLTLPKKD